MSGLVGGFLKQYQLIELIGQGGMASVYRARHSGQQEDVAIKVLSLQIAEDERFVRRFKREAGLVSRLKHPHVVPVIDFGEDDGRVFLVMPHVAGETLQRRMTRQALSDREAGIWIGQIADALSYAHQRGLVHRDVKPSNVMIDGQGLALLMDFGLARMAGGSTTLTGSMLMGTPAYVSPEQARGEPLDARSDQYSLAVIMYQIAAQRLPFQAESPMATALMHVQEPVPRISQFQNRVAPALERVILKALSKSREERFNSVSQLKQAYQEALAGEPVDWVHMPTQISRRPEGPASIVARAQPQKRSDRSEPDRPGGVRGLLAVIILLLLLIVGVLVGPRLRALIDASGDPDVVPIGGISLNETQNLTPTFTLPAPSATAPIQTATPVFSQTCPGLRLIGFRRQENDVFWQIDNDSGVDLRLIDASLTFPIVEDQALESLMLNQTVLWDLSQGGFSIPRDERSLIAAETVSELRLRFVWGDFQSGYSMELILESEPQDGLICNLATVW